MMAHLRTIPDEFDAKTQVLMPAMSFPEISSFCLPLKLYIEQEIQSYDRLSSTEKHGNNQLRSTNLDNTCYSFIEPRDISHVTEPEKKSFLQLCPMCNLKLSESWDQTQILQHIHECLMTVVPAPSILDVDANIM
jgi:hypothetical protein